MKKIKYIGGSWASSLTVGKLYDVIREDHHYLIKSDNGSEIYQEKYWFEESIHNPEDVIVGQLYKSRMFGDSILYLGCQNYDTREKFLLIAVDDSLSQSVGKTVTQNIKMPIWTNGFIKC